MEKIIFTEDEVKNLSTKDLLNKLETVESGLNADDVKIRTQIYGLNEITEKKVTPFMKFLGYFIGPIPVMIEIATVLSAIIGKWDDFAIILILLLFNAVVGFYQENKADNAIELLKEKLSVVARVIRDGAWMQLEAKQLVPGDIVRIRPGDSVPADLRLLTGEYVMSDEAALTGESLPVEKHVGDILYAGSIVKQGEMVAVAVATGMNTFFGKTAKLVSEAKTQSHLQKAVMKIGNFLIIFALILVIMIFIAQLIRNGLTASNFKSTLEYSLVLTIAAIPAALPAVLSVTMVVGAIALSKKDALVSNLVSIEEMAGMDILCSDKTGTITKNELTVAETVPLNGFSENDVLLYGTEASRAENNDPIDNAIITLAQKNGALTGVSYQTLHFAPFDPVSKRTEAEIAVNKETFYVTKGAPQVIAALTGNTNLDKYVTRFAEKGHRALAVAKTDEKDNWVLVGLIALFDPARDDSAETIRIAEQMGITVKMVTGDHTAIAKETARAVNLGTNIVKASTFLDKPEDEAAQLIENADGFAEVYPEHKYRIVELLQSKDHIICMTGDGVNDAPALKKADCGIAVAGATDAAKSAAAIVLTRPGLSVIIDAIKQARRIFERMTNFTTYRIAETIRVLVFTALSILLFNVVPVTALMIVLIALINDFPMMTIASDNVYYSDYPVRWNLKRILVSSSFLGGIGLIDSFFLLFLGKYWPWLGFADANHHFLTAAGSAVLLITSFNYLKLAFAGQLTVLLARTNKHFWSVKPSNSLMWAVFGTQMVVFILVLFNIIPGLPALSAKAFIFLFFEVIIYFVITDYIKVGLYKVLDIIETEKMSKGYKSLALYMFIGIIMPIAGLIIYLVNNRKAPVRGKSAGVGSAIGLIIDVCIVIALFLLHIL